MDAATGQPAEWKPVPTVLPVSERLQALVSGPEYEEAVAAAAPRFAYRVLPRTATAAARPCERRPTVESARRHREGAPRCPPRRALPARSSPPSRCRAVCSPPRAAGADAVSPAAGGRSRRPRLVVFVSVDQMRADYLDALPAALHGRPQAPRRAGRRLHERALPPRLHGDRPRPLGAALGPLAAQLRASWATPGTTARCGGASTSSTTRRCACSEERGRTASPSYFNGFTVGDMLKARSPALEGRGRLVQGPRGDPDGRQAGRRRRTGTRRRRALRHEQLVHRPRRPRWLESWNARRLPDGYAGRAWERLLPDPASYVRATPARTTSRASGTARTRPSRTASAGRRRRSTTTTACAARRSRTRSCSSSRPPR